jgi:hypothetical protein
MICRIRPFRLHKGKLDIQTSLGILDLPITNYKTMIMIRFINQPRPKQEAVSTLASLNAILFLKKLALQVRI